jgi:hypothetical protein
MGSGPCLFLILYTGFFFEKKCFVGKEKEKDAMKG